MVSAVTAFCAGLSGLDGVCIYGLFCVFVGGLAGFWGAREAHRLEAKSRHDEEGTDGKR